MDREELEKTIIKYLKRHYGGTMSTIREDGSPQASGISYVSDGLILYFGMDPESEKKKNVDRNPNVGVAIFKDYYRLDKIKAVQLAGRCEKVANDAEAAKAAALFPEKFPAMAEFKGMAEWANAVGPIPFYRITPKKIAYLDYPKYGFNKYEVLDL
jgi:nitroimidazol reductase NimA-like FMN-containing flavoprotein (pyridoxamine 5'-phosphate oxidase superfamily)